MTEYPPSELLKSDFRSRAMATIGAQPIATAAAALLLIVSGICAILLWRIATGASPEQDRVAAGRQVQARVVQTSEQIMENTKGIAQSQQESIDQLQSLQDQLNAIQQLVAAQRTGTSKIRFASDGARLVLILLKIITIFSPLRLFVPISAAMDIQMIGR